MWFIFMQVCYLSLTLLCTVTRWKRASLSPAWSRLHLHLITKRSPLYLHVLCSRTPSGVFTITCIISPPCLRGFIASLHDQGTTPLCKWVGVIIANCSRESNHMRWNLFSNHNKRGEHLLSPPASSLWYLQSLAPTCCYVYGLSVMAFVHTSTHSLWSSTSPERGDGVMKQIPEEK